jgi:hypothetical protein
LHRAVDRFGHRQQILLADLHPRGPIAKLGTVGSESINCRANAPRPARVLRQIRRLISGRCDVTTPSFRGRTLVSVDSSQLGI